MARNFFDRLRDYYSSVARVLRGEADAASVFPNSSDVGQARERVYAEFLKQHAPSKCNVFLGGFLFDDAGVESRQLDVLITTDTAPRFDFHNPQGMGKAFSPVEGTLGAASIKSTLDKAQLFDALEGLASIPQTRPLENRIPFTLTLRNYEDWPYKIIYATKGLSHGTILGHLAEFYASRPDVPFSRRPNIIHVAGAYAIFRATEGMSLQNPTQGASTDLTAGQFLPVITNSDLQAITWVINELQMRAMASQHILFEYGHLINKLVAAGLEETAP